MPIIWGPNKEVLSRVSPIAFTSPFAPKGEATFKIVKKHSDGTMTCRDAYFVFQSMRDTYVSFGEFLTDITTKQGILVSFMDFYLEAMSDGWSHNRIVALLESSLPEYMGSEQAANIVRQFNESELILFDLHQKEMAKVGITVTEPPRDDTPSEESKLLTATS